MACGVHIISQISAAREGDRKKKNYQEKHSPHGQRTTHTHTHTLRNAHDCRARISVNQGGGSSKQEKGFNWGESGRDEAIVNEEGDSLQS